MKCRGGSRLLGLALGLSVAVPAVAGDRVEYNRDIRPILSDNCFACHGPDKKHREAGLRIDVREEAVRDRDGSVAIVPGDVEASDLIDRIDSDEADRVMPPPKSRKVLTADQKALLRRWIAQGAEYQPHWSYVPLQRPGTPVLKDTALVRNPIDAFVQAPLEAKGIAPAAEADRRTLIRRLSLDLVGIPPTPAEVRAFVDDPAPDAYGALVDRLLKSPHYGERMAQPWLDVVRYADTVGFHGDQNMNVWAYRDYVIHAFNANKPFDRFAIEQIAGDLLPDPTEEQIIATCFNRLNMVTREGGAQPREYLAKSTADRIRTVGMAFLGSTFNCAECHDHKFDPITQKDFYALGAFFADVKQWGVYMDYGYTPNPDFRGYSNDHPFPPERLVESPALKRREGRLNDQIARVATAGPEPAALADWKSEIGRFLADHPDGWATPTPEVRLAGIAPKPKEKEAPAEPPAVAQEFRRAADGWVAFTGRPAHEATLTIAEPPRRIAAIRVEIRPDLATGKVVRNGDGTTIKPAFAIVADGQKPRPLAVRAAHADRYVPRYANGFEVFNLHSQGWRIDFRTLGRPHTAVYWLDAPVELKPGEQLQVVLPENQLADVRVGLSPLAPEIATTAFPAPLAGWLEDPTRARVAWLRSTGADPAAFAQVKAIESRSVPLRGGKTPVLVTESAEKPLTIRLLARGNWMDESGEIQQPATPGFLPGLPEAGQRPLNRLDLARWIASDANPLTARVVVNRLWKQLFGAGLSSQVDDLGAQGEPPSHPELLDWLAIDFRESGWDMKRLVKQIVTSHTYRQVAGPRPELRDLDSNNRWLAAQNPRRLEAEAVRDNALAIAGLLDPEIGGPPAFPYQPGGYYAGLQFPDRDYKADRDENQYRRGVYMHWQRTFLHPMLANFDAPSREDCVAIRTAANSPQQALTLLNDPEYVEAARVWAAGLLAPAGRSDSDRLETAIETALARPIRPRERESLLAFLARMREEYGSRPEDAAKLLKVGHAPAPEGNPVELAAWASVCRVILNLHETITRY